MRFRCNGLNYTAQDVPDFLYPADELEAHEELIDFIDFMLAVPAEHMLTLERCRKLRNMKPINTS